MCIPPQKVCSFLLTPLSTWLEFEATAWFARTRLCSVASVVSDSTTSWTAARQAPLSMGFSRQECWSGLPCPPPGDLPDPGVRPVSLMASFTGRQGSLPLVPPGNWYWNQEKNKSSFIVLLRIEMLSCNLPSRRYFSQKLPSTWGVRVILGDFKRETLSQDIFLSNL